MLVHATKSRRSCLRCCTLLDSRPTESSRRLLQSCATSPARLPKLLLRPRFFHASSQYLSEASGEDVDWAKEHTRDLLDVIPVGSMTEGDWQQEYSVLQWWTQQHTADALLVAWKLLHRFVQEEKNTNRQLLGSHWLNRVVEMSRRVLDETKNPPTLVVGPLEWLQSIDSYQPYLQPNHATYGMVMNAITKYHPVKDDRVELVQSLLDRMYEECHDNPSVTPDVTTYNAVLNACAQAHDAQRAEHVMERMRSNEIEPDVISFSSLISAKSQTPHKAEAILREMQQSDSIVVNTIVYNNVIAAWSKSVFKESTAKCEALWNEMLSQYVNENKEEVKPNAATFGMVIMKLTFGGNVPRADGILREMAAWYCDGKLEIPPQRKLYDAILQQWPNARSKEGGERAHSLLAEMHQLYREGLLDLKPKKENFKAVVANWTKRRDPRAPQRAQDVLGWLQEFALEEHDSSLKPDTVMCTSIINAWSKSRVPDAPERAESLLRKMEEWYEAGNEEVKPNDFSYHAVMKAFAKSRSPHAPQRTEAVLRKMQQSNVKSSAMSYNILMNAWANSNDPAGPDRAEYILRFMDEQYRKGDKEMKPSKVSYATAIKVWAANAQVEGAPERAESLLRYMKEVYESTGDADVKPHTAAYSHAILAWVHSKAPNAAERAAMLLTEMMELREPVTLFEERPRKEVYFSVLQALASSDSPNAGQMAESIVLRMQELSDAGFAHMNPTTKFFNLVLRSWAHSGHDLAAERAESILKLMQELQKEGRTDLQTNALSFNFVIKAWANSGDIFAGRRAELHLRTMTERYEAGDEECKPTSYTYRDLAVAWSLSGHAEGESKAGKYREIAQQLMSEHQDLADQDAETASPAPTGYDTEMTGSQGVSEPSVTMASIVAEAVDSEEREDTPAHVVQHQAPATTEKSEGARDWILFVANFPFRKLPLPLLLVEESEYRFPYNVLFLYRNNAC